jgi:Radical SAM superfamily
MNIGQIEPVNAPWALHPLNYSPREVPHATIETNRTCNLGCRSCYTLDKKSVKSFAHVKDEIDLALQKRDLQTVTILGGEPTLYPGLEDVIVYVKSRGLFCQLLSNGIVLLEDRGDEMLDRLARRGLDRILLHVDSGQRHVHNDLDAARRALFSMCEARRLHFFLSVTIYNEDQGQMPELLKAISVYRYFDGILAVLARDPHPPGSERADLAAECKSLADTLGLRPAAYIPSNLSDVDVRWVFYFYFINAKTKKTFSCSPRLDGAFRRTFRVLRGRELFAARWNPALTRLGFFLAGLFETIHSPGRIREAARVWKDSHAGRAIGFQCIVIQRPPDVHPQTGQLVFCHRCPDATVRNGRLAPVCVADHISPLAGAGTISLSGEAWAPDIYRHLGEGQEERRT